MAFSVFAVFLFVSVCFIHFVLIYQPLSTGPKGLGAGMPNSVFVSEFFGCGERPAWRLFHGLCVGFCQGLGNLLEAAGLRFVGLSLRFVGLPGLGAASLTPPRAKRAEKRTCYFAARVGNCPTNGNAIVVERVFWVVDDRQIVAVISLIFFDSFGDGGNVDFSLSCKVRSRQFSGAGSELLWYRLIRSVRLCPASARGRISSSWRPVSSDSLPPANVLSVWLR